MINLIHHLIMNYLNFRINFICSRKFMSHLPYFNFLLHYVFLLLQIYLLFYHPRIFQTFLRRTQAHLLYFCFCYFYFIIFLRHYYGDDFSHFHLHNYHLLSQILHFNKNYHYYYCYFCDEDEDDDYDED